MAKKLAQKVLKYTVIFEPAEEGGYVVSVPALPGYITEGDTLEKAMDMVKDAILAYIASLKKHREPIPEEQEPSLVTVIDIPMPDQPIKRKTIMSILKSVINVRFFEVEGNIPEMQICFPL